MNPLGNVPAAIRFEWRRSKSLSRIIWWLVLALFPALIAVMVLLNGAELPPPVLAGMLFALVPMVMCMLGVFLWSTPAVASELERGSWVYLAVRPGGGTAMLLGKYVVAVAWTIPAAFVGLTLALLIAPGGEIPAGPDGEPLMPEVTRFAIWFRLGHLAILSSLAYAAVYSLIGVLIPKRAMVVAVAYTIIFEFAVGLVPAMINKLTIQFRLRSLFVAWLDIPLPGRAGQGLSLSNLVTDAPAWNNVAILLLEAAGFLLAAVLALRWREFTSTAESQE